MAANDRHASLHGALAGLVLVVATAALADDRPAVGDLEVDCDLRRELRGRNYILLQNGHCADYRLWLLDADRDDSEPGEWLTPDEDTLRDRLEWNQAIAALHETDGDARIDALTTLADIDPTLAAGHCRDALYDHDGAVRIAAIELLGEMGETGILVESWWLVPTSEQITIVDALGDIDAPRSTAFLKAVANSGNATLADAASQYLDERE